MTEYVPPLVDIQVAYRLYELGLLVDPDSKPYDPIETARVDAEFDRWLETVKADAWDEGVAAQCATYGMTPDPGPNPHREVR